MRLLRDKIEDVIMVEKVLQSMISKFTFFVCSIEESNDIDPISIDELHSSLLVHEKHFNNKQQQQKNMHYKLWHIKEEANTKKRWSLRFERKREKELKFQVMKIDKFRITCYLCDHLVKGKIENEKILEQYKKNQDGAILLMVC